MSKVFGNENFKRSKVYSIILLLAVINTLINNVFGLANLLGFIFIILFMALGFKLLFKKDILTIVFTLLIGVVFMFILELVVGYIFVYMFNLSPTKLLELSILRILAIFLSKVSFLLLIWFGIYRIPLIGYIKNKSKTPIVFIAVFNIIIIYMTFTLYNYMDGSSTHEYLVLFTVTVGAIVFSWFIYLFVKKIMDQEQQEELMKVKIREYENRDFYIKNMEDLMLNIQGQRHDLNNYVSTLYGLIQLEKIEDAKKYILDLERNLSFANQIMDTNHPVITALINVKYQKAGREKISMNVDINLPQSISIEYIDLSIVLGNLLDNAIEACLKSGSESPVIELRMYIKRNYLIIKAENSKTDKVIFNKELKHKKYTTKEDKDNHGFGLNNIQRVIDQYKGILNLEDTGHIFKVHIAIPLESDTN